MRRIAILLGLAAALTVADSAGAVRPAHLTIIHYYRGCHVWSLDGTSAFGPSASFTSLRGGRLHIDNHDIMAFIFRQTAGPALAWGDPLTRPSGTRTLTFRSRGVYRFEARATQHHEELGVQTIGPDNVLVLTVRVR